MNARNALLGVRRVLDAATNEFGIAYLAVHMRPWYNPRRYTAGRWRFRIVRGDGKVLEIINGR